jgi:uncharacterized protein YndB with AHSA1/START domain
MNKERFVYVTYIATTPEKVWKALIDGELTRQYWQGENVSDWKTGSKWKHVRPNAAGTVRVVGEVLESVPNKRLVMTWANPSDEADATKHARLAIDIEDTGEVVRLTITHDELEPEMARSISNGWPVVLSSMKSLLETGRAMDVSKYTCKT